jgi:ATP-dependent protease Clp ATPase subunit
MQIARANDLLKPEEINLKDPNGLGNITRKELSIRVYNHYQIQNQNEEAGSNEAGIKDAAI